MKTIDRLDRLRPSYIRSGLKSSGTAADLRRVKSAALRLRSRLSGAGNQADTHRPLRILAHVPNYAPHGLGGAESSIQATVEFLQAQGHDIVVVIDEFDTSRYTHRTIPVHARPSRAALNHLYESSDVILTQKSSSIRSHMLATRHGKPLTVFVRDIGEWRKLPREPDILVFNAAWQRDMFEYEGESLVVHPPIDPARYRTTPGSRVTLINLNERKGGLMFLDLVAHMPQVAFLAVSSVWGDKTIPDPLPANLKVVEATDDVREIYSQTRVLLLPSKWESYGRVAVEAAVSGIPVVSSPNPGTFEALGNAAIYANRSSIEEWEDAIRSLDDDEFYQRKSDEVSRRAAQVTNNDELYELEVRLRDLVTKAPTRSGSTQALKTTTCSDDVE